MDDVLDALEVRGWELLDPESKYQVEQEVVRWEFEHTRTLTRVTLEFHLFDVLGKRTESLSDILYCQLDDPSVRLYFEKRSSEKWREAVADFAYAVRADGSTPSESSNRTG